MNERSTAQGGTDRLTQGLRVQLQEMTAAVYALASDVADNKRALEYLAVLNRSICAQLRLIRQVELDARLNSPDEIRLERSQVDLVALCRGLMGRVDALARPLLDIRAEFSSSLTALTTIADANALEEMLLCLISNSVRAIGRDGTVRLELEHCGDKAVFTVTDTGAGLDPAALKDLFELDEEQEDADRPARGLLLVRRIAGLHGGTPVAGNTGTGGARLAVSIPITDRGPGVVCSPNLAVDRGGWDSAKVALSDCLPPQAFAPDRGKR